MNYAASLHRLLAAAIQHDASDLHISVGRRPTLRVYGTLVTLDEEEVITPEIAQGLIEELLSPAQKERFLRERQLDFAYALTDNTRFRVNAYFQQNNWSAALRLVPAKIRTLDELGLPPILHEFAKLSQGFILMVGPAGHGKSTTTAAILDEINRTRTAHIITIEDPIEYLFGQGKGIVSQREVGSDTPSFADGLKTVLRQDPDVLMVGEMRDTDSIAAAITAAETGHLVFSTLHTNSASQTIDRIIDSFPPQQQGQIITQIATTLVAIVSERLIPRIGGGRVPAVEVMITNAAIRNLIRERKIFSIDSVIQTGMKENMILLNHSLAQLVKNKQVTIEDAEIYSLNPTELRRLL
jgi:twitching motility protein PilT